MPTTATATTSKVNVTVEVLHQRPAGFTPCEGSDVVVGDALYDPNTGVHTVDALVTPPYTATFRRARSDGWQNAIFDDHTYLVRYGPNHGPNHQSNQPERSQP